jgi:hypothetical protein
VTYPRWIAGGPADVSVRSNVLLREVADGLFVGSSLALPIIGQCAAVQLSDRCPWHDGPTLRMPFADGTAIPDDVLHAAVVFARAWRGTLPVLVQCHAGLSRSASVAYAIMRRVDRLSHAEALARVAHSQEHNDRTLHWPNMHTLASAKAWCDVMENR